MESSRTVRHRPSVGQRRGAVAVEFAIATAIAFVFFFAAIEFCRVAVIEHTVNHAVYEGLRSGTMPGGDAAEVVRTSRRILSTIGIDDARITVTPTTMDRHTHQLQIDIQVPLDSNSLVPTNFFHGRAIERSLTMPREGLAGQPRDDANPNPKRSRGIDVRPIPR